MVFERTQESLINMSWLYPAVRCCVGCNQNSYREKKPKNEKRLVSLETILLQKSKWSHQEKTIKLNRDFLGVSQWSIGKESAFQCRGYGFNRWSWTKIPHCCCCSTTKSCLILCDSMDCSMPDSSVLHCFLEFAQIHVHWVCDAI